MDATTARPGQRRFFSKDSDLAQVILAPIAGTDLYRVTFARFRGMSRVKHAHRELPQVEAEAKFTEWVEQLTERGWRQRG